MSHAIERHKKKTWTTYIVYVHRGIAKHLTRYIRVKAHTIRVSILSFTLACSLNFGEISMNKNLKLDASSICLFSFVMLSYAHPFLGVQHLIIYYNVSIFSMVRPVTSETCAEDIPICKRFLAISKAFFCSPSTRPSSRPFAMPFASAVRIAPSLS